VDSSIYLSNISPKAPASSSVRSIGSVQVRPIILEDVADVADLIGDSFRIGAAFGRWLRPLFKLGIREDLRSRWQDGASENSVCWVATVVNSAPPIVGTIEVSNRSTLQLPAPQKRYAYIANLAVDREYRCLGIAQQLIGQCEVAAKDWGFCFIYLHVMADNQAANHLYRKLGFEVLSSDKTWHILPWKRNSRLFLRKSL
jgi:ribosomal protein S18 acetylase RimI-like enzyme